MTFSERVRLTTFVTVILLCVAIATAGFFLNDDGGDYVC